EQNAVPRFPPGIQQLPSHVHVGQNPRSDIGQLAHQNILGDLRLTKPAAQSIVVHKDAINLRTESVEVLQILHANSSPADLVLVSRADAAPGRADTAATSCLLAHDVELAMEWQDERRIFGDTQVVPRYRNALLFQP